MDSDFSVRNELDSVVRGPASDSDKYKVENPFSKLVDALNTEPEQAKTQQSFPTAGFPTSDSWKEQALFASAVAQQQADVAHRAIDLMYRSLHNPPNYWKYVAIGSLGVIVIILLVYWRSNVNLQLVPKTNSVI